MDQTLTQILNTLFELTATLAQDRQRIAALEALLAAQDADPPRDGE